MSKSAASKRTPRKMVSTAGELRSHVRSASSGDDGGREGTEVSLEVVSNVGEVEHGPSSEVGSVAGGEGVEEDEEEMEEYVGPSGDEDMQDKYPTWDSESHKTSEVVGGNPMMAQQEVSMRWVR